jgi:hypothetical protein
MNCHSCTDTYGEALDASDRRWRTLCACERLVVCRCKQRATHAFLDDEGEVDRFVCNRHGVSAEDRAGIETVHGVKVVAATAEADAPQRERGKKLSGGVLVHISCRCGKSVYEGRDPTRDDQMKALGAIKSCSVCQHGRRKTG